MQDFNEKVKFTVPRYIVDFLNADMYDFGLNKNNLCNRIFYSYFDNNNNSLSYQKNNKNKTLQFTLNELNLNLFIDAETNLAVQYKADYFRNIFTRYCTQPRYMRELSIFNKEVIKIEQAIQSQRKLTIRFANALRVIEPYAILNSVNETRNYVFAFCHKRQEYRNFRLCNIEAVSVHEKDVFEHYDPVLLEEVSANFDPFLSSLKVVKVRLTEQGQSIYQHHITHRPEILSQDGDVFEFECSEERAKLYFSKFFGDAEILEPLSLREYFKNSALKMAELYQ
jgi:hypothetical protein